MASAVLAGPDGGVGGGGGGGPGHAAASSGSARASPRTRISARWAFAHRLA
jgi:hypothetical protein